MIRSLLHILGRFPVVVLRRLARGAWWSAYPCSAYWRLGGNDPEVEAFEPDHVSLGRLRWHRRLNRLAHLHIHPVAASSVSGEARLYQYDGFGATTSHLPYPGEGLENVASHPVPTARLDDWVHEGRIHPPAFIKLDVEGHALPALEGMRDTLARHRPVTLLAVHTANERDGCRALLSALGYAFDPVSAAVGERIESAAFGELVCLPPAAR